MRASWLHPFPWTDDAVWSSAVQDGHGGGGTGGGWLSIRESLRHGWPGGSAGVLCQHAPCSHSRQGNFGVDAGMCPRRSPWRDRERGSAFQQDRERSQCAQRIRAKPLGADDVQSDRGQDVPVQPGAGWH